MLFLITIINYNYITTYTFETKTQEGAFIIKKIKYFYLATETLEELNLAYKR